MFFARKRSDSGNSTDVGHSGVFTGCEGLSLSSSIAAGGWTPAERS
ncbi:hypothetical protein [Lysinibacillus sp. CTST325]